MTYCGYTKVASENRLAIIPRSYDRQRFAFMLHGHSSAATGPYGVVPTAGYGWAVAKILLDLGIAICLPDAGGGKGWNGPVAVDHLVDAHASMVSEYGCADAPADVLGFSMGGSLGATFAQEHPELTRSLVLTCPAVDIQYVHDTNLNGYGEAELEAAYGGSLAAYQAALPVRDTLARASELDGVTPGLIYHSAPSDTVVPLDSINQFALDAGADIYQDESQGHDPDIAATAALADFLLEHA